MRRSKLWLQRLLVILGAGLMVATIPVFFPVELMATIHGWLGLGEFPATQSRSTLRDRLRCCTRFMVRSC